VLCHDLDVKCWHSGAVINGVSRNTSHVGICWAGDSVPNDAQMEGLQEAVAFVRLQVGSRRMLPIEGHRDAPYATQCPGNRWREWIGLL